MNEMQKTLKTILNIYKPVKNKRIIKQQKQEKLKEAKKQTKKDSKKEIQESIELDDIQKTFISKYIEYSQLSLLNQSAEQLTSTFEKTLGTNAQAAIKQLMNKTNEREMKISNLAKQLTALKEQMIKETEKARAKETLIDLANNISVPVKKSKPQFNKSKQTNNFDDFDNDLDSDSNQFSDVTSSINVVESKKKSKKK